MKLLRGRLKDMQAIPKLGYGLGYGNNFRDGSGVGTGDGYRKWFGDKNGIHSSYGYSNSEGSGSGIAKHGWEKLL
jgi:hypothetical protein